jgi:hypothetical protein
VLTIPAARYLHRRRGPAWGIAFPAAYWVLLVGGGLLVTRGNMTWQSLLACLACAAISTGYGVYLAIRRGDLRAADAGWEESPEPSMRSCPGCGLDIDARSRKCPACGRESDGN